MFYTGYVALRSMKAMENHFAWRLLKNKRWQHVKRKMKIITMSFYTFLTVMSIIIQHGATLQSQINCRTP